MSDTKNNKQTIQNGKGSRPRHRLLKYSINYDNINWSKKSKKVKNNRTT